jgi:glycosyltransferase involved in cell wall biosynthesis
MEAVAGEVACLRRAFPGSISWGISARQKKNFVLRDGIGVHPRLDLLFRGITWAMQRRYDIQHLFGGWGDWFHLRSVQKRPTILTVALDNATRCDAALLDKVDRFVVEWPDARRTLIDWGIERDKVQVIYPAVDLKRFQPSLPPAGPFTVLFASSPDRGDWLSARGVELILDAAALLPAVRFLLVWRPWGDSLPVVQQWIKARSLENVQVVAGRFPDMAFFYGQAHVTVAPFTDIGRCKPAPNSIAESLACGRPVVVTPCVGLSQVIQDGKAGLVCNENGVTLAESVQTIHSDWDTFSERARELAVRIFCCSNFVRRYRQLYQELM